MPFAHRLAKSMGSIGLLQRLAHQHHRGETPMAARCVSRRGAREQLQSSALLDRQYWRGQCYQFPSRSRTLAGASGFFDFGPVPGGAGSMDGEATAVGIGPAR